MDKITFALFSYNDAYRIEYVIRNFLPYGKVIVFDDHSTDNTREVVEKLGVEFIIRPKTKENFVEAEETFLFVKQHTKTPWLYWGWTDNLLPKQLVEKMVEISGQTKYKYVYVPVYTYMWGDTKTITAKAKYGNFFMPEYMDFKNNRIHSIGKFLGKDEEKLELPYRDEYAIRHFSLYDMNKFILAHLRYTNQEAEQKIQDGRKFSLYYMFGSMANYFYIFYRRAFRGGVRALYGAMLFMFFRLMVAVRLYELEHGMTLQTMEAEYAKAKQKIIDEIEKR